MTQVNLTEVEVSTILIALTMQIKEQLETLQETDPTFDIKEFQNEVFHLQNLADAYEKLATEV